MKKALWLCAFVMFSTVAAAKDSDSAFLADMAENFMQVRQKPGTEKLLRDYLQGVDLRADTIYMVLYVPTNCPRCEAVIGQLRRLMRSIDSSKEMLLASAYKDKEAARLYNKRKGYKADAYLYDTASRYEKIFSFNMNGLYGLQIMKVCRSTGEMIVGGCPTNLDKATVKWLLGYDKPLPKKIYVSDEDHCGVVPQYMALAKVAEETQLAFADSCTMSDTKGAATFCGDKFLYLDKLGESTYLFSQEGKVLRQRATLRPDESEKTAFVSISREGYSEMLKGNMVFHIPLWSWLSEDGSEADMLYSLPYICYEGGDTANVVYYNRPAMLRRRLSDMSPMSMIPFEMIETDTPGIYFEPFAPTVMGPYTIVGCKKLTWPAGMPRESYEHDTANNPF